MLPDGIRLSFRSPETIGSVAYIVNISSRPFSVLSPILKISADDSCFHIVRNLVVVALVLCPTPFLRSNAPVVALRQRRRRPVPRSIFLLTPPDQKPWAIEIKRSVSPKLEKGFTLLAISPAAKAHCHHVVYDIMVHQAVPLCKRLAQCP